MNEHGSYSDEGRTLCVQHVYQYQIDIALVSTDANEKWKIF